MNKTFTFHTDPGHGWLEVTVNDLSSISLVPSDFTQCSYRKGNTLYLEEDCDAGKFINAWKARGNTCTINEVYHKYFFARNLPSIW